MSDRITFAWCSRIQRLRYGHSGRSIEAFRPRCLRVVLLTVVLGLAGMNAWADQLEVTTFFLPNGTKSLAVSGAPAGSYSVCLGLITGQRQCNFAQGTVKNGGFTVNVPTTAGQVVANFSFSITKADGSVQNWRRIGNTDGKAITLPSELQKGSALPNLQNPNGTQFASSSTSAFDVLGTGLFTEFDLTSSNTNYPYEVTSASIYDGLNSTFLQPGIFDSPAAIASGMLAAEFTDSLIPAASGDADPAVSFTVGPVDSSGYELLVATLAPIIDPSSGALGTPEIFDIAAQALPVPEPPTLAAMGGAMILLALVRQRRRITRIPRH